MATHTVYCPLGDCRSAVELEQGEGAYYIRAYSGDPRRPPGYRQPEPEHRLGGDDIVDPSDRRQVVVQCTASHYLEVLITTTHVLETDAFVIGPVRTDDDRRCPQCSYRFDDLPEEYVIPERTNPHTLQSVTTERLTGYEEVQTIGRQDLADNQRLAVRNTCPHCGELVACNYELDQ